MKVAYIRIAFGGILSSIIIGASFVSSASAVVTHETHSDVQFTFNPIIALNLSSTTTDCPSPYLDPTFCIENLAPGNLALSNTITANVATNSAVGYTLSATVGGTALDTTTTFSDNKLTLAGTSGVAADTFEMISSGVSTLSAGQWGYTLDSGTTYGALPYVADTTATPTILNKTVDSSNTPAVGYTGTANTNIQIGAYADTTQIAGAYKNVVNFTAVTNMLTRTVTLNKNNADVATVNIVSVDGTPITPTTAGTYGEGQVLGIEATCANNTNFWGWGISGDFGTITNRDNATTTYTIGGNDVILTAYCGTPNYPAMQEVTASMCTATPTIVRDSRDNKLYTIARLADGQCWMVSDLNLAGGTKLDSEGSDVPAGYTQASPYFTLPASSTTGFDDDTKAFVYNSGNETTNQADCTETQPCNSYYSWLAATAGGKDASGTAVTGSGLDTAYSICPKGWRLPKSGKYDDTSATSTVGYKKGDFYKLATAYGANLESSYAQNSSVFYNNAGPGTLPNFLLAGYYGSSTFYDVGSRGRYWSSSSSSSTSAYNLYFHSSYVGSANYNVRRFGISVRCVLR